jgi:hypothetical protein
VADAKGWAPVELDESEHVLVAWLCQNESINLDNPPAGVVLKDLEASINQLVEAGLVGSDASRGNVFRLLTRECLVACLPDGRVIAGENVSGRMTRWLDRNMEPQEE